MIPNDEIPVRAETMDSRCGTGYQCRDLGNDSVFIASLHNSMSFSGTRCQHGRLSRMSQCWLGALFCNYKNPKPGFKVNPTHCLSLPGDLALSLQQDPARADIASCKIPQLPTFKLHLVIFLLMSFWVALSAPPWITLWSVCNHCLPSKSSSSHLRVDPIGKCVGVRDRTDSLWSLWIYAESPWMNRLPTLRRRWSVTST